MAMERIQRGAGAGYGDARNEIKGRFVVPTIHHLHSSPTPSPASVAAPSISAPSHSFALVLVRSHILLHRRFSFLVSRRHTQSDRKRGRGRERERQGELESGREGGKEGEREGELRERDLSWGILSLPS